MRLKMVLHHRVIGSDALRSATGASQEAIKTETSGHYGREYIYMWRQLSIRVTPAARDRVFKIMKELDPEVGSK